MAKVSLVIPVYGVEKYIHQCLDSIINQTFTDFEVILVDDGSPDNCPQICDEYAQKDSRIKVIHKKNGGVSAARNDGLKATSGEWVYFVDSDDWIEPDALEKLVGRGEETGADCVISDPNGCYPNKTLRGITFAQEFCSEDREVIEGIQKLMLCRGYSPYLTSHQTFGIAAPWAKFVRASVLKDNNVEFDPYLMGRFDDGLWSLYMLDHVKKVAYISVPTYNYRFVSTSITKSFKPNALMILERGYEKTAEFIEKTKKDNSFVVASYARIVRYTSMQLSQYFFSPANPKKGAEALKELKEVLNREPYKTAFEKVDTSKLERNHRFVVFCVKCRFYLMLKLYSRLHEYKMKSLG